MRRFASSAIQAQTTVRKRRVDFLAFMDEVLAETPAKRAIHVILDNEPWLAAHPNVTFHFTPTSASWLNQFEIWFGIFSRKAPTGASFRSTEQLREAIEAFIAAYQSHAKPFIWREREVAGSQLRNTIANLCSSTLE
jgi:DDE superfamily endonuclease